MFVAICVIVLILAVFVEYVPKSAKTLSHMRCVQDRILAYYSKYGTLPNSLADIPQSSAFDNTITDGWGQQIGYRTSGNNVILESFGRDCTLGGTGQDEDIFLVFDPSTSNGLEPYTSTLPSSPQTSGQREFIL